MSQGNTKYNLVIAKLMARDVAIRDFNQHLEYFRDVLREVYGNDYGRITKEIKGCLDDLVLEKDIAEFFKIMES